MNSSEVINKIFGNDLSNKIIVEVGSNDGSDTLIFDAMLNDSIIYCFEPDNRCWDKLIRLKFKNNVILSNKAMSDYIGIADFYKSSGNPGNEWMYYGDWDKSGSLYKPTGHINIHPWCKFENTINVDVSTIDATITEKIDLLWIDAQGADYNVLKGGINTLLNTAYIILEYSTIELYDNYKSVDDILELLTNFSILEKTSTDILFKNKLMV